MQKTPPFKIEAELSGVSTKKDGSLGVRFNTQELDIQNKLSIMEYVNKFGWLLFSPANITEKDIPDKDPEIEGKTPSQRLRNVLYVLWNEKSNEPDFESYYRKQMNKIIETLKSKIDD